MSDIPRDPQAVEGEEVELGPIEEGDDAPEGDEGLEADGDEAGGDAGDEGEAQEEVDDDVAPAPRRGGGSATVRAQRARAQAAEREAGALREQIAALTANQRAIEQRLANDPAAQAAAEAREREQVALMTPDEVARYYAQKSEQRVFQAIQASEFRANDRADKQAYDAAARTSRVHQQYRSQVEQVLSSERAQGRNPDREIILKYLVGNDVLDRANRAAPGQRQRAAARVSGQRTQPTGSRGNVPAQARRPAPGSIEADRALLQGAIDRGEQVF